jgi:hypothetical protein
MAQVQTSNCYANDASGSPSTAAMPIPQPERGILIAIDLSDAMGEALCTNSQLQQQLQEFIFSFITQDSKMQSFSKQKRTERVRELTTAILHSGGPLANEFSDRLRKAFGTRSALGKAVLSGMGDCLRSLGLPITIMFYRDDEAPLVGMCHRPKEEEVLMSFESQQFDEQEVILRWQNMDKVAPPFWSSFFNLFGGAAKDFQRLSNVGKAKKPLPAHVLLLSSAAGRETSSNLIVAAAHRLLLSAKSLEEVPVFCSVSLGCTSSKRLALLEDFCAWSGGLSFAITSIDELRTVIASLSDHSLNQKFDERKIRAEERRAFHLNKAKLGSLSAPFPPCRFDTPATSSTQPTNHFQMHDFEDLLSECFPKSVSPMEIQTPTIDMTNILTDTEFTASRRWAHS